MRKIFLILFICLLFLSCTIDYRNLAAHTPDMTKIDDGVYRGIYNLTGTPVNIVLDVNVQNNKISKIEIIEHASSAIGKKAEIIIDTVIEKQSLEIDTISGATASSKSILLAIENALR